MEILYAAVPLLLLMILAIVIIGLMAWAKSHDDQFEDDYRDHLAPRDED